MDINISILPTRLPDLPCYLPPQEDALSLKQAFPNINEVAVVELMNTKEYPEYLWFERRIQQLHEEGRKIPSGWQTSFDERRKQLLGGGWYPREFIAARSIADGKTIAPVLSQEQIDRAIFSPY